MTKNAEPENVVKLTASDYDIISNSKFLIIQCSITGIQKTVNTFLKARIAGNHTNPEVAHMDAIGFLTETPRNCSRELRRPYRQQLMLEWMLELQWIGWHEGECSSREKRIKEEEDDGCCS
ncbi:unnamed protein product [Caenorhabditis nigoni]